MRILCLLLFVFFPFWGCASSNPVVKNSQQWRMQQLESSFFEFKDQNREERQWQDQQLADLQARLDQLSYMLRREVGSRTPVNASREFNSSALASSAKNKTKSQEAGQTNGKQTEKKTAKQGLDKNQKKQEAAKDTSQETGLKDSYQQALQTLRAGHVELAREQFRQFVQDHPEHELAPNAYYWLAETYYTQNKFAQSILAFKKVTDSFPGHHKAADALLKIGYAYINLDDLDNAQFYLNVLIEDYPESRAAELARERLKNIE